MLVEKTSEYVCKSIGCLETLGYFDIKNKRRFCRKCRSTNPILRWKCQSCTTILSTPQCRETRLYCDNCQTKKRHD